MPGDAPPSNGGNFDDGSNPGNPVTDGDPSDHYENWYGGEPGGPGIAGALNRSGVLKFSIERGPNTPEGWVMFQRMFNALGGKERITGIDGEWSVFEGMTTNLEQFNSNIARGMNESQAALNTFTGRQAYRYYYRTVTVANKLGPEANYYLVEVSFRE